MREIEGLGPFLGGVFVPTMGALHEGHGALVRLAAAEARRRGGASGGAAGESGPGGALPVVVSVFVNPTQFNERADFERYPRMVEVDAALAAGAGATCVFAPPVEVVYPGGAEATKPREGELPRVARAPGLEDRFRPGHFAGVAQVVRRLFDLVRPVAAVFGEKDWQQLQVVRAMVAGDGSGIEVVAGATVREADGLAMSSRNRFLSAEERVRARAISGALRAAREERVAREAEARMRGILEEARLEVEYAVVRDAETLEAVDEAGERAGRALIAARAGAVRLIDNMAWP